MFLCNDFVWPIGQLEQEKGGHFLSSFSFAHYCCTAVANRATELKSLLKEHFYFQFLKTHLRKILCTSILIRSATIIVEVSMT